MSATVLFSPAATADVLDIWNYTVAEWGLEQAELYTLELSLMCEKLAEGIGFEMVADYIRPGYRKVLVGRHVIYFIRQKREVVIVRILHQSMDVEEI